MTVGASSARSGRHRISEVLAVSLRLGVTSFGGPIAHLGYFRREYVERRAWLDEHAYADLLALCQFLPGPASSQLGIAIGTQRAGMLGGLAAWLGFTLPSAIVLVLFGLLTQEVDLSTAGWVHGLKLAAVAVVAHAVYAMAQTLTPDWPRRAIAVLAAAVALLWTTPFSQVAIIAAGALVGRFLLARPEARPTGPEPSPVPRRIGVLALGLFAGLLLALPLLRAIVDNQGLALFDAFYRAGALVFGGGHVVLPLLHTTVVDSAWVSNDAFLAGYGAAQAVPGPLFTYAAYLGTVSTVPPNGVAGASIALVAIFLPSFLLIFGVMPFWDGLRGSAGFRRASFGTNAAVVGILVAAFITPVWTSAVSGPLDVAIAAGGFGLLVTGRTSPIVVVALCALLGQTIAS
ncbi:MAG: chromate efflux transporter [Chloroflexi bacterium]|nr:chromate efflux transporter [Chloroflexota bacterium]